MIKYDRNYFKVNDMLFQKYFGGDNLVLTRFNTIEDIASVLDKDFEDYGIRVKEYAFKEDYDSDFQDYELMVVMGNNEEDFIDITIYYATTRIGEKIITETSYEII